LYLSQIEEIFLFWKMDLFNQNRETSILPYDGETIYYGKIMDVKEATDFYKILMESIEWKNDEAFIFGKHFVTKRKVAWYGDRNFHYTYSKATKHALPWTKELLALKKIAEEKSGATYNSCLLSFGADRRFLFKHKKTKDTIGLTLEHGSLLVMKGTTQTHWMHRLPKTKKAKTPRVNLTFRKMIQGI